ncbi:ER-bound oxygenase mpaB/mpaB'/Rubber oxygenase catalytic domain-containing protein [Madurella fahalii]|uniref:ER-bound oxygenase mpaB/mpaB'/Rubber oxygenase catalytic domain-containing protein n=1 Tax=Madurella fahalii TaxID=1157608 RepID=A0ABQ0G581_9PEZI
MLPYKLENGRRVGAWGYEFEWTPDHLTAEQLRSMIFSYDELATKCLDRFDDLPLTSKTKPRRQERSNDTAPEMGHPDLYDILRSRAPEDETLQRLWHQVTTVPVWVDWAQLERGQKVFYRYAGPSIVGLTFQSLLGGMGSPRVVETLNRTGGFGVKIVRRRLLETFQHVLDVTRSLRSIQPGGQGFASSIRVRLLHASVRRRILALVRSQPDYYSLAEHGVPINDLNSIATITAFSATLIWISFPRQGIRLGAGEVADYLALWRYVAHLLGTPTHPFSSPRLARATMESPLLSELSPSPTSRALANNMIAALASQPPTYASAGFLRAEAHWLNGRQLADALGVPRPRWYHTVLVAGQCLFFAAVCYARRSVPAWDEAGIKRARVLLERVTLEQTGGEVAMHGFKYVPGCREGTQCDPAGDGEGERGKEGGWREGGVEARNLKVVIVASVVVGWVVWLGFKGVSELLLQVAGSIS